MIWINVALIWFAISMPVALMLIFVNFVEGQAKKKKGPSQTDDLIYGDGNEVPREFRGLAWRYDK
jgi:hypothetical protein